MRTRLVHWIIMNEPCVTGHYDDMDTSIENVTMFTATSEETKKSSVLKKVIKISSL